MQQPRVILFHKQATSARTRFLRLAHGGVCGPEPLPELAQMQEGGATEALVSHPAVVVGLAERRLGLPGGSLEAEGGFRATVDTAAGPLEVFLARFTAIDPPFAVAEAAGAAFIDLTQARHLRPVELMLLRRAYETILG